MARIILLLSILSLPAFAQTYNLEKCISLALANHTEVKNAQLSLDQVANISKQTKSQTFPDFSAGLYQGGNFGRSIDRFTNDYIDQFYNNTFGSVQFNMPLYAGLSNKYQIEALKNREMAAFENLRATKNKITRAVIVAFMTYLSDRELYALSQKQEEITKKQIEFIQKKIDSGLASKIELFQLQSQLGLNQLSVLDANLRLKGSLLGIFQTMNLAYQENIVIDFNEILVENYEPKTLEEILETQAEKKQYEFLLKSADYAIRTEKAAKLPKLSLGGDYGLFYASTNKERSFGQQLNDTRNGSINLNLRIPIASNFKVKPLIEAQKIQKLILENNYRTVLLNLSNQIEMALMQYKMTKERFQKSKEILEISKTSADFVQKQFESGLVSIESLMLVKNALERSEINLIQAKYRMHQESKILDYFYNGNAN